MQKPKNLQSVFLNEARRTKVSVSIFLVNGFQLRGTITGFDTYTVILFSEGRQQMIFKHAISTIVPVQVLDLSNFDGTPPEAQDNTEA